MDKRHKGTFHLRGYNDGKKYMRRCSMSLITREMQIKITVRYYYISIRMDKIKKKIVTAPKGGKNANKLDTSLIVGRDVEQCNYSVKQFGSFLKTNHTLTRLPSNHTHGPSCQRNENIHAKKKKKTTLHINVLSSLI